MSPEQARGEVEAIGPATDVYALGAMLYHLLSGHAPYLDAGAGSDSFSLLTRLRSGPPPAVSASRRDVPPELAAICERAMARQPSDRYATVKALGEDLRAYLELRVVRAYETGAVAELRKWILRNRPLATAVAAAVVLLIAGFLTSSIFFVDARENAREAERQAHDVLSLSALRDMEQLIERARSAWPVHPDRDAEYAAWLTDARELVASLPTHRSRLEQLRARGRARDPQEEERWLLAQPGYAEIAELGRTIESRRRVHQELDAPPEWDEHPDLGG
jgi:hypothetical protein